MNKLLTKSVAWSYPTSPNAERFGFAQGCYTLELTDPAGIIPPQPLKGYATEAEALAAAHKLPQQWDRLFLKYSHPEFASTSQGDEEERRHMLRADKHEYQDFDDSQCGGVFDGMGNVSSDADSGL